MPDDLPLQADALASSLTQLTPHCASALGAQPIEAVLRVGKLLEQLAADCNRLLEELPVRFGPPAAALRLDEPFRLLQDRLAGFLRLSLGKDPDSRPLAQIDQIGRQWLSDFVAFTDNLCAEGKRFELRVRLSEQFEGIGRSLQQACFRLGRPAWSDCRAAAVQALERGDEPSAVEEALRPLCLAWTDSEPGRQLARHYGAENPWPVAERPQERSPAEWLNESLAAVAVWMDREQERLAQLDLARLPDSPTGTEAWFGGATALLAMHLELRLTANRVAKQKVAPTLLRLAELADCSRACQHWAFDESEIPGLLQLLGLTLFDERLADCLDGAARLIDDPSRALALTATLLSQAVHRHPLWRLPPEALARAGTGQGFGLLRQAARQACVPVPVVLHLLAAGSPEPTETARRLLQDPQAGADLIDLGPLGAWLLAGCLQAAGEPIGPGRLEELFAGRADDVRPGLLVPLVTLRRLLPNETGTVALLAALELLTHRRNPDLLPMEATWAFQDRWAHEYPTLCRRFQRFQTDPDASTRTSERPGDAGAELQAAEAAAQGDVRPRSYRGVRSVERISRAFVDEVAGRLLAGGREAESSDAIEAVLEEVQAQRDQVDDYLRHQSRNDLHPPEGQLREALRHGCTSMLDSVQRYLELRLRQARDGTLRPGAGRAALEEELDRLGRRRSRRTAACLPVAAAVAAAALAGGHGG